jgi:LuxR family transcriptional regulator, maltose regulon positive regulatory protein
MTEIESVEPHLRDALTALEFEPNTVKNWPENIPLEKAEMLAQVYALRTFVAVNRGEPERGIQIARDALSHLPVDDRLSRFALLAALGDAYRDADNFAAASQAYSEALAISEVIDHAEHAASLTMRMDLARLRVKMGQLRHAEAICHDVLDWGGERYHPLFPAAQAYTLLGDIQRERNNFDAAEQTLSAGIRQCEWAGYQRYLVYSHISAARLKCAQGNILMTERSIESAERTASLSGNKPLLNWVRQFRARLLSGDSENWLENSKLTLDDEGLFQREDEYLTLARLQLKRARPTDPQPVFRLLERLLTSAQKSARTGSAIEIMLLQALSLHQLGRIPEALQKFNQSLTLAEPEGYVRLFVDEGAPVAELLILAIQHNLHPEYANHLLSLIPVRRSTAGNLTEALTEREGEVLRLLATGLSNQEIAEKLVISLSTIKTHITRIYGKLDVTSRTQAILRARELKMI